MNDKCKQIAIEPIASGKWLQLECISYQNKLGESHSWESVSRKRCDGAVAIIAILKPSNRLLLIRQYRAPADGYVYEFPAGLIDPGETAETTAHRELHEETGYTGSITQLIPPVFNSPGLTDETVYLAQMAIDEEAAENQNVTPAPEASEDIQPVFVPLTDLTHLPEQISAAGDLLDAKVASFILSRQTDLQFS